MSDSFDIITTQFNPLDGVAISAGPMLVMAPVGEHTRLSLRISRKKLSKTSRAFGLDIPAKIGRMSSEGEKTAICLGPDEWLLLAPVDEGEDIIASFSEISEQTTHSLVDVSHRTVGIDISGPAASLVLNAGCPLDLDAMAVESCTRSVLDKAEIILMKLGKEHYRVEIARSFAEFVWNFLSSAGHEFDAEPSQRD